MAVVKPTMSFYELAQDTLVTMKQLGSGGMEWPGCVGFILDGEEVFAEAAQRRFFGHR